MFGWSIEFTVEQLCGDKRRCELARDNGVRSKPI